MRCPSRQSELSKKILYFDSRTELRSHIIIEIHKYPVLQEIHRHRKIEYPLVVEAYPSHVCDNEVT